MLESTYGVKANGHIPGTVLNRYLTDFAHHFGFFEKIQFRTKIEAIEPAGEAWKLFLTSDSGERMAVAKKLILATGLTSTPNMPTYAGQENLKAPLFHAKEFCARASDLENVTTSVVIGGTKSAFDMAYAQVQAGSTVDLVVRDNAHGPVWIAPAFVTPPKKRLDQLLLVRCMT
jgi:cation diffusion facilitator CzcD-associated flavoprotein CzcO